MCSSSSPFSYTLLGLEQAARSLRLGWESLPLGPCVLVLGAERTGLPPEVREWDTLSYAIAVFGAGGRDVAHTCMDIMF